AQRLVRLFIERITSPGVFKEPDRSILDNICPHISIQDYNADRDDDEDEVDDDDEAEMEDMDEKADPHYAFISMLLRFLYSGQFSPSTKVGVAM
ncbi:hypothetical protein BG011_003673, partial [Mortierella polycephala]